MTQAVHAIDRRDASQIGRHARLELRFGSRNGRTVVAHAYAEPPFRIGHCFDDGAGLHLILALTAPGVFPGDCFDQSVVVEAGAQVRLTSQSSLQLHPGPAPSPATIESRYEVQTGATLSCDWHPVIPFPSADFAQRIAVDVAGDARLRWSDATMSGRESRGERWQFRRLAHELRVSREGALAYLERYVIAPGCDAPHARWAAGPASYFGTMLAMGHDYDRTRVDGLQSQVETCGDVDVVADLVAEHLLLVRLMSRHGAPFHSARAKIASWW